MRKVILLLLSALLVVSASALLVPNTAAWMAVVRGPSTAEAVAIDAEGDVISVGQPNLTVVKMAGATGEVKWRYNALGDDPSDVAVDANGDVFVGTGNGTVLKMFGLNGALAWRQPGCGSKIALDRNGDVIVAGSLLGRFNVCKLNGLTGTTAWHYKRDGSAAAVAVDRFGNVAAAGASNENFAVVKLRGSDGLELWEREQDGVGVNTSLDAARAVALDSDGGVIAVGDTHNSARSDVTVAKYAPNGDRRWVRVMDGNWCVSINDRRVCQSQDEGYAVALGRDGSVFAAGLMQTDADPDTDGATEHFYVTRFSSDGTQIWAGAAEDLPSKGEFRPGIAATISIDSVGDVVAAGQHNHRFTVVKFNGTTGKRMWVQQSGLPPAPGNLSTATRVATDVRNNLIAVGATMDESQNSLFTVVKLSPDGTDYVEEAEKNKLGLLTYNIRGGSCGSKRTGGDLTHLVDTLRGVKDLYALDVVVLQEIYKDQADAIAMGLGFSHIHFFPTIFLCGGERRGNAILSRYPIEAQKFHVFDAQEKEGNNERRNIIGIRIRVANQPVHIYTTHLTSRPPGQGSDRPNKTRARQATESVNFIKAERPTAVRAIMMGDFNAEPITSFKPSVGPYAAVIREFRDSWALALPPRELNDPSGYTNATGGIFPPPSKRIDYVFLRKESRISLVSLTVLKWVNLSDHFPVFARIAFD